MAQLLLVAIAGIALYIFIDQVTKPCYNSEDEAVTLHRLSCEGGNITTTTITTCRGPNVLTGEWELDASSLRCIKRAGCVNTLINAFISWIKVNPSIGSLVYIYTYVVLTNLFVPGLVFTLGAGYAYGSIYSITKAAVVGMLIMWIAMLQSCVVAFFTGRFALRKWVAKALVKVPLLAALDKCLVEHGIKIVALCRMSPTVPFHIFNLAMGGEFYEVEERHIVLPYSLYHVTNYITFYLYPHAASAVSFKAYFFGSLVGLLPLNGLYIFAGVLAGTANNPSSLTASCSTDTTINFVLVIVGAIATVCVAVLIVYYTKKELTEMIEATNKGDDNQSRGEGRRLSAVGLMELHERSYDSGPESPREDTGGGSGQVRLEDILTKCDGERDAAKVSRSV
jgi:uncharacterized membrane protein YdjX (TVP38/TMEM64 family)